MNRFLPNMPSRWTYAGIVLAALLVVSRVLEVLANPANINPIGVLVTVVVSAVVGYLLVFVVYVLVGLVRR